MFTPADMEQPLMHVAPGLSAAGTMRMATRLDGRHDEVIGLPDGMIGEEEVQAQDFYLQHGPMNGVGSALSVLRDLPHGTAALCEIAQGVLIHRDIASWLYGLNLSGEQRDLANTRPVARMIAEIQSRNAKSLREAREPADRMPCVCWHFSSLIAAILREQGVPARARCGFGTYFKPGRFEDHWVAEYWKSVECRWVLVDAQLDAVQRKAFRVDFDPTDVPRDRFILAGDAWQQCRAGRTDPNLFGLSIINEQGLWWIGSSMPIARSRKMYQSDCSNCVQAQTGSEPGIAILAE